MPPNRVGVSHEALRDELLSDCVEISRPLSPSDDEGTLVVLALVSTSCEQMATPVVPQKRVVTVKSPPPEEPSCWQLSFDDPESIQQTNDAIAAIPVAVVYHQGAFEFAV
jgi:hypothetical protein